MPPLMLFVVGLTVAGFIAALVVLLRPEKAAEGEAAVAASSPAPHAPQDRAPVLTRFLTAAGLNNKLQQRLLAAGLLLRPSELLAGSFVTGAVAAAAVMVLKHSIVLAAPAAVFGFMLPYVLVIMRIGQRQAQFRKQLPEALEMIASALRSGYSFARAVQLVAEQMNSPLKDEAQRMVDELAVGMTLDEALDNLAERQPSYEVKLFVAAVQIQTRVGGNLAEILLKTAQMMREREQLRREIAALTAEGRMSAGILAALPVVLAVAVNHMNPGYMNIMFTDPMGRYMLVAAAGLMLMGLFTIKQLINVDM